jgi:hypothetical protein
MLSWLVATAVLLIDPSAKRTDVTGVVDAEVRGGWAPVSQYAPPAAGAVIVLAPTGILEHTHRRFGTFSISYTPRLFLRQPNRLSLRRPLIYHQLGLTYRRNLSPQWRVTSTLAGRYGELDYNAAGAAFDPGQTDIGDASVLSFASADSTTSFSGQVSQRVSLSLSGVAGHRRPVILDGAGDSGGGLATAARTYGTLSILPGYRLTARDNLTLGFTPSVFDFDPGSVFLSVDARAGYQRSLTADLQLFVNGGLFASRLLAEQDAIIEQRPVVVFPVGDVGVNGRLRSRARYRIDGRGSVGTFGLYEAASGRLVYRGRVIGAVSVSLPPRWSIGANASLMTSTTRAPLTAVGGRRRPETFGALQTPVRYLIDATKSVEFGTIVTVRAPHMLVLSRADTAYEAWAYVAFRLTAGTSRAQAAAAQ